MNRSATEDVRSPVWPVISKVLRSGSAPSARDQQIVDILDDWVRRDAPRLDADNNGLYDEAAPAILDGIARPIAEAVVRPVFGDLTDDLNDVRNLGSRSGDSYVDKDLRTLLGAMSAAGSTCATAETGRSPRAARRCGPRFTRRRTDRPPSSTIRTRRRG